MSGAYIYFTGQIISLESADVKTHTLFNSHGGFLLYSILHHRETIKPILTNCDEKSKSLINHRQAGLKKATGVVTPGQTKDKHQAPSHR